MKKSTFGLFLLVPVLCASLMWTLYAYRNSSRPIMTAALQVEGQELFLPLSSLSCAAPTSCQLHLPNEVTLALEFRFDPPGSPFGSCQANSPSGGIPCTMKTRFYFRGSESIRPYVVLDGGQLEADLPLTFRARMGLATVMAAFGLGFGLPWSMLSLMVGVMSGGWVLKRSLFPVEKRPDSALGYGRRLAVVGLTLVLGGLTAVVVSGTALLLFYVTGLIVD